MFLAQSNLSDTSILHGDGTTTAAKKCDDVIGYSGLKHQMGEKIVAIVGHHANNHLLITAPANIKENKCNCNVARRESMIKVFFRKDFTLLAFVWKDKFKQLLILNYQVFTSNQLSKLYHLNLNRNTKCTLFSDCLKGFANVL